MTQPPSRPFSAAVASLIPVRDPESCMSCAARAVWFDGDQFWCQTCAWDFWRLPHFYEQAKQEQQKPPHPYESWPEFNFAGAWTRLYPFRLVPQYRAGHRRLDFGLWIDGHKFDIEVDGAPYHNDFMNRQRDRELKAQGWHVIRVTASDVQRDAEAAVHEVVRQILVLLSPGSRAARKLEAA